MKKIKKLIFPIIILIVAVILIVLGILFFTNKDSEEVADNLFYSYPESERKTVKNCKKSDCEIPQEDTYLQLKLNTSYKLLDEKIDSINKDTLEYYNTVSKSNTNGSNCSNVKKIYYHEKRVTTDYFNYENEYYVSIAVQRTEYNLCSNDVTRSQVEWYMYDKENDKLLTQEELIEIEDITQEEINKAITSAIDIINKEEDTEVSLQNDYSDIVLFYDYDGAILVSFYVPEMKLYYIGNIR
jgi:hypothetical protein